MNETPVFNEEEILEENYEKAQEILEEPDKVEKLLKKMVRKLKRLPFMKEQLADLPYMAMMINSYIRKQYTKVPVASILTLIAAISYFVLPIDVIPDFLPVIGFLDDLGVIGLALGCVKNELDAYMDWRAEMGLDITEPLTE